MKKAVVMMAALAGLVTGCRQDKETPKVTYEGKKPERAAAVKSDSAQIKVADLPVLMEGTDYLIHPIGDIRVYDDVSRSYGTTRTNNNVSYAISNYNRFEITGYLENLKFQHRDSLTLYTLTDKKIQIQTATYLNTIADKYKKKLFAYTLVDTDTNKDGKTDANDIRSLYISDSSGKGFTKLSGDMQELIDWNIIDAQGRLYFRTIEDINKNGAFDKNDAVHYFYVDLLAAGFTPVAYEPVN